MNLHPDLKSLEGACVRRTHLHCIINDKEVSYPLEVVLCFNCDGHGKHLITSLRDVAFSSDDEDYDPDFMDEMRNGSYDQQCEICRGEGRLLDIVPPTQYNEAYSLITDEINSLQAIAAEDRYTLYMESGGMLGSRY